MAQQLALVLGATGGIGGEVARKLLVRGWRVRALNRKAMVDRNDGIEWVQGDAMQRADVVQAAQGATLIVHAVNPPGYQRWAELVLPMLDNTIAAARASGARILLPGTVYNYGPDAFAHLDESAPQQPLTRKGKIRVELERRLKAASQQGVRTLIVRAGDFFGPQVGNSWFAQGLVKAGQPVRAVGRPGPEGVGHQWAYVPDVAETMLRLVECGDRLGAFETFHMDGHWDKDGLQMAGAIGRAVDDPVITVRPIPWWLFTLASPFVTVFRELREMRYLWQQPVRMRNDKLVALLGSEPHTPLDEAVRTTLQGLGCLPEAALAAV
ncbi:SDR family oxidoreductase [Chitinimonas sp.]|uniref:SDR family oxidoreductase n=1 Tax=Chitinimonas sp. TaxID=1934313 RepID=UPI002F92B085